MIVVDSGLGGLAVVRALQAAGASCAYLADTAGFPYGHRDPADINARTMRLMAAVNAQVKPQTFVLACNTLSTLCLASLREGFAQRFVGTVPAVKVAAAQSLSRRFTLLATPNTVDSAYSRQLIAEFAADCRVDRVGAPNLARLAERHLLGGAVTDDAWLAEIALAFQDDAQGRTDAVVLGCTHYPLVLAALERVAPWPVRWIDSSAAIARQALAVGGGGSLAVAYVTATADVARYAALFAREGFAETRALIF